MNKEIEDVFEFNSEEFRIESTAFITVATPKDLFYMTGDENYLENKKNNEGINFILEKDLVLTKNYNGKDIEFPQEITETIEELVKISKEEELETRKYLKKVDEMWKEKTNKNIIPYILKELNITIDSIKRPTSFSELDIITLINILYNRDVTDIQHNIQSLTRLMCYDNNAIILTLYLLLKKLIQHFDIESNDLIIFSVVIGIILATEKSLEFPKTLTEAYIIFYNEIFNTFSNTAGYIVLHCSYFYPIIYFNKMPRNFFKAFPFLEKDEVYDIRIEIQNILKECVNDDKWIIENQFDEYTLFLLCVYVLTDYFSSKECPIKISKQEKFEFAFSLFLLIIKSLPKNIFKSADLFWQNRIISVFMQCYISDNDMRYNQDYEIGNQDVRKEIIKKLQSTNDLDFTIFMFIIANQIKDNELLELIKDKDEIKIFAFDKSNRIKDLLLELKDYNLKKVLQSIEDYFSYQTNEKANILISILKETYNDLGNSYNELLTSTIHDMIDSKIEYESIYNEVKSILTLKAINENERKRIYDLISTGDYILKANNVGNFSPSVNQYCSALEVLLNEIIYKPYFYEIQDICIFKNNNRGFTRDDNVKKKYFGDTPHAMWIKGNKLSLMSLGDLKILMENIMSDIERLEIFIKATDKIFNKIDIKSFFSYICGSIETIKPDRDFSSHGGLINHDEAKKIRAKVYKNESKEKLNPTDLILKIDKNLKK